MADSRTMDMTTGKPLKLIMCFANGLNSGYGIIVSRIFGAKNRERLKSTVAEPVTWVLCAVFLEIVYYVTRKKTIPLEDE